MRLAHRRKHRRVNVLNALSVAVRVERLAPPAAQRGLKISRRAQDDVSKLDGRLQAPARARDVRAVHVGQRVAVEQRAQHEVRKVQQRERRGLFTRGFHGNAELMRPYRVQSR